MGVGMGITQRRRLRPSVCGVLAWVTAPKSVEVLSLHSKFVYCLDGLFFLWLAR